VGLKSGISLYGNTHLLASENRLLRTIFWSERDDQVAIHCFKPRKPEQSVRFVVVKLALLPLSRRASRKINGAAHQPARGGYTLKVEKHRNSSYLLIHLFHVLLTFLWWKQQKTHESAYICLFSFRIIATWSDPNGVLHKTPRSVTPTLHRVKLLR
jgi:hypothetical protein